MLRFFPSPCKICFLFAVGSAMSFAINFISSSSAWFISVLKTVNKWFVCVCVCEWVCLCLAVRVVVSVSLIKT